MQTLGVFLQCNAYSTNDSHICNFVVHQCHTFAYWTCICAGLVCKPFLCRKQIYPNVCADSSFGFAIVQIVFRLQIQVRMWFCKMHIGLSIFCRTWLVHGHTCLLHFLQSLVAHMHATNSQFTLTKSIAMLVDFVVKFSNVYVSNVQACCFAHLQIWLLTLKRCVLHTFKSCLQMCNLG